MEDLQTHGTSKAVQAPGEKSADLTAIYREHEEAVKAYTRAEVCRPGCSFCCTHFGPLDVTTFGKSHGIVINRMVSQEKE